MPSGSQIAKIDALLGAGALEEAAALLETFLAAAPDSRAALMRLIDVELLRKRPTVALSYADRLTTLAAFDHDALFYQAKAELCCGNTAAALGLIDRLEGLLERRPAPFLLLKGNALAAAGNDRAAARAFEAALDLDPGYMPAYACLDQSLRRLNDPAEALAVWKRRVARAPGEASAWTRLAQVSSALGEPEEAVACLERAVALDPRRADTWYGLGSLYAESHRFEKARQCLRQSVALDPGQEGATTLLGRISNELGDTHAALAALNPAGRGRASFGRRLAHALLLPQIYESGADLERWRARYSSGLAAMHAALDSSYRGCDEVFALNQTNFLLAYQGQNDLSLQREYARLLRRMIARVRPDLVDAHPPLGTRGARIRVAFVSSFFRECTIGHYFLSWITCLDPAVFEPIVISTGGQPDATTKTLAAAAEKFVISRGDALEVATDILALRPDIIVYPEIGMHSTNYMLANMRLAPAQCAAWGHPVTTGSELIDYYFTCASMEPPERHLHYAEKLLDLPRLGTRYAQPPATNGGLAREAFALPADRHLYVCSQSLFKVHPDNDGIYLDILAADEKAVVVFFREQSDLVTKSFADRITRGMVDRGIPPRNQVKFLPRLGVESFRSVLVLADAVLDTLHWSGGNSSLDALSTGAPVVTLPGAFMRGRQSKAMLEMLGVPELIATDTRDYVAIALRLAADSGYRAEVRERILDNRGELFGRQEPLGVLAQHLERIHGSFK